MQHPRRAPIGFELNLRGKSRGVKKHRTAPLQFSKVGLVAW